MAYISKIPNDQRNQQLLMAIESIPGVRPATGWVRMNGTLDFPAVSGALSDYQDATGTYMGAASPSRTTAAPSGNFSAPASFESLARWLRLGIEAGGTPDSGSGPDYTYAKEPPLTQDNVDTATFLTGVLGNGEQVSGVRLNETNLSIDYGSANGFWELSGTATAAGDPIELADGFEGEWTSATATTGTMTGAAWTVDEYAGTFVFFQFGTGTGQVRQIVSNTADTVTWSTPLEAGDVPTAGDPFRIAGQFPAGVAALDEEKIIAPGTKTWILPAGSTPDDTNDIRNRVISANVSVALNLDPKGFLENEPGTLSGIYGRGELAITGQVQMEFDRYDELRQMKNMDELLIQFERLGSDLGGGVRKLARVTVPRAVWNAPTRGNRNNNLTQTLSFRAYQATPPLVITTRNGLASL